jgi:hypothetical protein
MSPQDRRLACHGARPADIAGKMPADIAGKMPALQRLMKKARAPV